MDKTGYYLLEEEVREILSPYYGDSKRIPFTSVLIRSDTEATSLWTIKDSDCEGHFNNTLPGHLLLEASCQTVIVLFRYLGRFEGHYPMLRGGGSFDIANPIIPGNAVIFSLKITDFQGKKGLATSIIELGGMKIAEFTNIKFRAQKIGALERLQRQRAA